MCQHMLGVWAAPRSWRGALQLGCLFGESKEAHCILGSELTYLLLGDADARRHGRSNVF